jgi:hypothetical protein
MSYSPPEATADRVDRIEATVEKLSRELERSRSANVVWRVATALGALTAIALAVLPATGLFKLPVVFDAEDKGAVSSPGFTLLNRESRKTVILDNDKYGTPNLAFIDPQGNYRMDLKVDHGSVAALNFYDSRGKRGRFSVANNSDAILEVTGAEGKGGVVIRVGADGASQFKLLDASGKTLFEAPSAAP